MTEDPVADIEDDAHTDPDGPPPPDLPSVKGGLEAQRPWRIAECLEVLRKQINSLAPNRDKVSDGGIGDAAHQSSNSDHNPWVVDAGKGVVTARDFTHSPKTGCDAGVIAEALRASRDRRIKYIIWNRRICASEARDGQSAWAWRPYTGKNPHNHHVHVSVRPEKTLYDDAKPFELRSVTTLETAPAPAPSASREDQLEAIEKAVEALSRRTPLLERLADLKDSSDRAVATDAAALLTRYVALTAEPPAHAAAPAASTQTFEAAALAPEYEKLFKTCTVRPEWTGQVKWYCGKLVQYRPRYEVIAIATGVPWWVVGALHAMEGGFDFNTHLHNGDPLTARTVRVPAGMPKSGTPPFTWEDSAIDALRHDRLADLTDWSIPATLFRLERYNGFGSRRKGINTPYLWSFSNHYTKGKFVRDGVYDPEAVSKQCGAAVMLRMLIDTGVIKG